MALLVQKYGGSSVASAQRIQAVARRIIAAKEKGNQVVVVVSAMGDTTDDLIQLAYSITPRPDEREMDLLLSTGEVVSCTLMAMALKALGHQAVSLTGFQAGIRTEASYGQARILRVDPERIRRELEAGRIVVVAGFQGITDNQDITTLGRGGSDTTAVALAAALGAPRCEIYTDVEGVYTADPRLVPQARKLPEIGYEEMLELATYGARVMHPRAVELGQAWNLPILVASSFTEAPGTLIHGGVLSALRTPTSSISLEESESSSKGGPSMEVRNKVRGIAHELNVAKVTVRGVPDRPGIAAAIFEPLARAGVSVDTIVQNASVENITDLSFTLAKGDLAKAMPLVEAVARDIGAAGCLGEPGLGKVSIVGSGMQNAPGYAARMFRALYEAGINIEMITTSEIRITCLIREEMVKDAVVALHRAFELDKV